MCEFDRGDGVGDGQQGDGFVAVTVAAVVGVGGGAGRTVVVVITPWAVLGIGVIAARVVHKVAFAAGAKVAVLAWVGAAVAVAAIVDAAGVVARWLAFNAIVVVVGAVVIAVRCLDVAIRGGVVVLGNLCLLRLRYRGRIAVSNS